MGNPPEGRGIVQQANTPLLGVVSTALMSWREPGVVPDYRSTV